MSYVTTIGLEVHVQLKTHSKMFCACPIEFGAEPNRHTCPVCLGLPGALPAMNREALRLTVLTGLMLGCEIGETSKFDRKNYFYPDMPKNYQISQYDKPLCTSGRVPLYQLDYPKEVQKNMAGGGREVQLTRIHLEEDVAKSFHFEATTGIDFNRAGTPLMEIVTNPEIGGPDEAFAFLTALRQMLVYGKVSDADMEKGQMRCDANISVRPASQESLGAKIEIKNLNSISGVRRALAYEAKRQADTLESGGTLSQETRGWDDDRGETFLMRTKESAHDYRYFPDPDLVLVTTAELVKSVRPNIPELPTAKRARFVEEYQVSEYDAGVLAGDLELARYFELAAAGAKKPKTVANWVLNDLQNALGSSGQTIAQCPVPPAALEELIGLMEAGKISSSQAREVFAEMFASGRKATEIVEARGLEQLSDGAALAALCDKVIAEHPKPSADFQAGNAASLNFLKGQVMKLSKGRANPQAIGAILETKLRESGEAGDISPSSP